MKRKISSQDATPPKEIYRSIIADYTLILGICELVDNAIDIWHRKGTKHDLNISIELNNEFQRITVEDNAGGISEEEIIYFMSPGRTSNIGTDDTIGIFGVGSKRALVALAQNIKVRSRSNLNKTIEVGIDESWLKEENWLFDVFVVDDINKDTTIIEMFNLRKSLTKEDIDNLTEHLSATYAYFLQDPKIHLFVNDDRIVPRFFDSEWSYPPNYNPKEVILDLPVESKIVKVKIIAGLLKEGASADDEYGVYIYCNERLITRANRSFELGYTKGKAGLPNHPSIALARIIVKINGEAQYMPWNSSKSEINYKHTVFEKLRDEIINVVIYYVSLSRRFQGEWPEKVFYYSNGDVEKSKIKTLQEIKRLYSIPLPQGKIKQQDKIKQNNRELSHKKPWVVGLYEGVIACDVILKQNLEQRNRFGLIMLDSTLEIAFKEYLANDLDEPIGSSRLKNILSNRAEVIKEIKIKYPYIDSDIWRKINYYYKMRCDLIHESASTAIKEEDVLNYKEVVQTILRKLFGVNFGV